MIKQIGRKEFYLNSAYDYLKDIPIPPCFVFMFNVFLELYNNASSENGFTFADIENWQKVRKISLKQIEIEYIIKCKTWANSQVSKMEFEE